MESLQEVSEAQYTLLLDFMERHGDIGRPQPRSHGQLDAEHLWQELANSMNTVGPSNKSCEQWKKVWADWKCQTMEKALHILCRDVGVDNEANKMVALIGIAARQLANNGEAQDLIVITRGIQSTSSETVSVSQANIQPSTSRPTLRSLSRRQRFRRIFEAARRHTPRAGGAPTVPVTATLRRRHGTAPPRVVRVPAAERLMALNRVARIFLAIEHHHAKLEELKLRNEARNIEAQQRKNVLLTQIIEFVKTATQTFIQKNEEEPQQE